jgi:glycosyltransferase involved in cell wall biosynthesis
MPATVDVVRDLGLVDYVHVTGFVTDQQLGALYRGATMCVMPSLFEGFGMPAVESMMMGKPTLVSGLPVLREVTLNSAQYFDDPTSADAMCEKVVEILASPGHYTPSAELVAQLRNTFAPQTIARRYLEVLTN